MATINGSFVTAQQVVQNGINGVLSMCRMLCAGINIKAAQHHDCVLEALVIVFHSCLLCAGLSRTHTRIRTRNAFAACGKRKMVQGVVIEGGYILDVS